MRADAPQVIADPRGSYTQLSYNYVNSATRLLLASLALFKYLENHSYSPAAAVSVIWSKKHIETLSEALLSQLWLCCTLLWRWHYTVTEKWPSYLYAVLHLALG